MEPYHLMACSSGTGVRETDILLGPKVYITFSITE